MPTALITGATGYIGGRLAERLVATGWRVHALCRAGGAAVPAGCARHVYDGSLASIAQALADAGEVDVVFHLASCVLAQHHAAELDKLLDANVRFPTQLLEALSGTPTRRVVVAGTHWQNAGQTDDYLPFSLYGATKQAFEDLAAWYVRARGFSIASLRLFDVYGPADPRRKVLSLLLEAAAMGAPLPMSPGEQRLDFVHIDDVVAAFVLSAAWLQHSPAPVHETFTVRSGQDLSLRELAALLERVTERRLDIRWGELPYRPHEIMRPWARQAYPPGWQPVIGLEEGLRDLCRMREQAGGTAVRG